MVQTLKYLPRIKEKLKKPQKIEVTITIKLIVTRISFYKPK